MRIRRVRTPTIDERKYLVYVFETSRIYSYIVIAPKAYWMKPRIMRYKWKSFTFTFFPLQFTLSMKPSKKEIEEGKKFRNMLNEKAP